MTIDKTMHLDNSKEKRMYTYEELTAYAEKARQETAKLLITAMNDDKEARQNRAGLQKAILVNTFFEQQYEHMYRTESITKKTYENYEGRYRVHIKPFFEGVMIDCVQTETAEEFIEYLCSKATISTGTAITIIKDAKRIFKRAVKKKYIKENPFDYIDLPKDKDKTEVLAINDDEIALLWKIARDEEKTAKGHYTYCCMAIPIMAITGMRRGEVLALTWDDLRQDSRGQWYLSVSKAMSSAKGKTEINMHTKTQAGKRRLYISAEFAGLLLDYKETVQHNSRHYILAQQRKDRPIDYRNFSRSFERWRKKAGDGIRQGIVVHSFRHKVATALFLEGVDVPTIMAYQGWSTPAMAYHYCSSEMIAKNSATAGDVMSKKYKGQFKYA